MASQSMIFLKNHINLLFGGEGNIFLNNKNTNLEFCFCGSYY